MDLFKILIKRVFYKIPIKLLLIIILTLLILSVCISPSFARSYDSSTYGSYFGFTEEQIEGINESIELYKGDYDSFLAYSERYGSTWLAFFNIAESNNLVCHNIDTNPLYIECSGMSTADANGKRSVINMTTGLTGSYYENGIKSYGNGEWRISPARVYTNRSIYTDYDYSTYAMKSSDISLQAPQTPTFTYNIYLSNTSNTTEPIYCYTDWYDISYSHIYESYISTDSENWTLMRYETITDNGTTQFRFRYPILNNGTYYYKFTNNDTEEDYYASLQVTNIISNSINSGFTESGIPQPFLSFKQVNDNYIIFTQYFNYEDILKYQCYFTDDISNTNYSSWNLADISSIYDTTFNKTNYYFSTSIPTDSENLTLYFVFYDTELDEFGYPSSITCDINGMDEYNNFLDNLINGETSPSGNFLDGFAVADITGIEQLFTKLYNAFCTDEVIDLTFTIPFVDKQVTISSENISSYYPEALTSVVALFVWGIIGLYVIKDIRGMINKINEGNIENISSDVKKEVL